MSDWPTVSIFSSSDENVTKYVFTKDDAVAEAVLYKYPTYADRTVICCSTQSGCPVGCRFCGTGEAFVRSLTVDEIVAQPVRLLADTGVDPTEMGRLQIMFMSMGEPLLNLRHLIPAMRQLHALFPNAALLISTSGPAVDYTPLIEVKMLDVGYSVRVFNPAGQDDIGGGCGQLWFVQQWMRDNPTLTHRSAGVGLTVRHAPRETT